MSKEDGGILEKEIQKELNLLEEKIGNLIKNAELLEEGLRDVLNPQESGASGNEESERNTPLAMRLQYYRLRIEGVSQRLSEVLERLEL